MSSPPVCAFVNNPSALHLGSTTSSSSSSSRHDLLTSRPTFDRLDCDCERPALRNRILAPRPTRTVCLSIDYEHGRSADSRPIVEVLFRHRSSPIAVIPQYESSSLMINKGHVRRPPRALRRQRRLLGDGLPVVVLLICHSRSAMHNPQADDFCVIYCVRQILCHAIHQRLVFVTAGRLLELALISGFQLFGQVGPSFELPTSPAVMRQHGILGHLCLHTSPDKLPHVYRRSFPSVRA